MKADDPDPRIAHAHVVAGPEDLVGDTLLILDVVHIDGRAVHIPRLLAGVPELVACRESEHRADELRERLLGTLVEQDPALWQPDTSLVIEMRSAADTAVTFRCGRPRSLLLASRTAPLGPGDGDGEVRERGINAARGT